MNRINRDRRLTTEEASKYSAIRDEIERDRPEITDSIRKRLAAAKRSLASQSGVLTFGQLICERRELIGESKVNIAAVAGIAESYLSQLEADEREPSFSVAARLAHALQVSLDELASCVA